MKSKPQYSAPSVALFVFVPFCRIKCTYCDFNAYANMARLMEPYALAVAREIERVAGALDQRWNAKSVYFGGGTPSLVPAEHVERMLMACERDFALAPRAEITLEANPGTVDLAKLHSFREMGINRLSLGVQSFDEATVRRLNRGHTVAQAIETYNLARRVGFDNINVDLIYGIPLQTMQDWRSSLQRALDLAPEHLSLYALKVEEGTGLEYQIAHGKYPAPDDDLAADMYSVAEEMLDAHRYDHYEISNWAKRDRSRSLESRHNLTYWLNEPYLGFGAGAHSFLRNERFWAVLQPRQYIECVQRGETAVGGRETIDRELEIAETVILGLRLGVGISFKRINERFGEDACSRFLPALQETAELGLVELTKTSARLTSRGRLLSNQVFYRLLPEKADEQ